MGAERERALWFDPHGGLAATGKCEKLGKRILISLYFSFNSH
jgi:hypothetical protein